MGADDRGAALFAYALVLMVIAVISVGLRFWSRALSPSERGPRYWWDDWVILSSLPFIVTSHTLVIYMTTLGLGKHVNNIPPSHEMEQLKALYACYIIYDISISLPKMSALLFYARVFGTQGKLFKYTLSITHFLVVGWLISTALIGVLLCDPVEKQWKPTTPGHCHPNTVLWLASAIPSVVIDLILLLLPLPMLWRLQMKRSRKVLIMTVFACGYCVVIISLGRLITVISTASALNEDLTYASVPTFYWLCAEAPVSVLSVCLPTLIPLFRRLVTIGPLSFSSTSSKFKLLRDRKKGTSSSGFTDEPLPIQRPGDLELVKQSFESTTRIFPGTVSVQNTAAAEPALGDSSQQIPFSAIRVKKELSTQVNSWMMGQEHGKKGFSAEDQPQLGHELLPGVTPEAGVGVAASSPSEHEFEERSREIKGLRWSIVVTAILSSTFLYALDNTIVANIRPSIIKSLGQIEKLPWISVAYAVGEVGSNPFWGKIYGLFNTKWLYLTSVLIFEAGSAVCGTSSTTNALIVGRSIAGVGGSGVYIGTINILSSLTEVSERPLYLSFVGMAWSLGTVLGPIIGGAFADSSLAWRWAFYINLCIAAAAAPACIWLLPSQPIDTTPSRLQRLSRVDFLGVTLFVGAITSLIMAIDFGGALFDWSSGQIIALFVVSGIAWILFSSQQAWCFMTTRSTRTFPVQYVASYEMSILFAQTSIAIAALIVPIYFIPLFFQFVRGDSALTAGVRILPLIFAAVTGAMINGALFAKADMYMPWFSVSGILVTIGGGLLSTISSHTSASQIYGYSVITGLGAGIVIQAPYTVAQAKRGLKEVSLVTAFISCGQMAGVALSISIGSSILLNQATDSIAVILPEVHRSTVQASIAGAGALFLDSMSDDQRTEVLASIASTLGHIFYMIVAGGALAVLLSMFMKRERLSLTQVQELAD